MRLSLSTYNSLNINNGSPFTSYIRSGQLATVAKSPVLVNRAGDDPFLSDVVRAGSTLIIQVLIPTADIDTNREVLKQYFFSDDARHNIVALDTADSNRSYYRTGIPIAMVQESERAKNSFFITIQTEQRYWQLSTATTDAWAITGTGDTQVITNAGNIPVPPVITLTPTTTKGAGLSYRRFITLYNNLDKSFVAPLDITNGGLDTATLTTAKMQTDGDDFRVWEDGSFSDRWLDSMDTANTKCWKNCAYSARKEATLLTTVNNSVQTLVFTQTKASKEFLQALKVVANRTLLIESEAITFDAANVDIVNYQITSVTRGAKTTSAASHTAPITVRHLEHDLWILYGDSSLGAQDIDDNYKPIINLSSTNAAWAYTYYYDGDSSRSAMWQGSATSKTGISYLFTDNENTFADPAEALGMALNNYQDSRVQFEVGTLAWVLTHPSGFTNVLFSGKKYYINSWPTIAGLQYLQPNTAWFTASNEGTPTAAESWETFGPNNIALGGTYDTIRFVIDGALDPTNNEAALLQVDTVTATIDSTRLPTISVGAENSINFFDFKITNNTTGEYLLVTTPCPVNMALTIDCTTKEAYLADGTRCVVRLSTDRDEWLNLSAGSNTLQYDDVGTVAITGTVQHRDRVL